MAPGRAPRVVVADDARPLRETIERLLAEAGFDVVGSCADAKSLLEMVGRRHPDVVLVDIRMPPSYTDEGFRAAQAIRARWPGVGVVVLTQYLEVGLATRLLAGGSEGCGFLLKDGLGDVPAFVAAVHRVASGGCAVDPIVLQQLSSPAISPLGSARRR